MAKLDSLPHVHPATRAAWRDWLAQHYNSEQGCWLIYYKKETGKPRVEYAEAVEEALCFGWIDSKPNKMDDERTKLLFTPRKPTSVWSKLNKERVARLQEQGLMTPAGQRLIDIAKANGMWEHLDVVDNLVMPDDLTHALQQNAAAKDFFDKLSVSNRKNVLQQLLAAKRPETRAKRLAGYMEAFEQGRNPLDWQAEQTRKGLRSAPPSFSSGCL